MSYRPTAAGHVAKEAPRTVAQEDIGQLVALANEWIERPELRIEDLIVLMRGRYRRADVVGLLAIDPRFNQEEKSWAAGTIMSALWNSYCPEKVIVYPYDAPEINIVGEELPAHKLLITKGNAGNFVGSKAEGPIIILGRTGIWAGIESTGPIIIDGETGEGAGHEARGPLIEARPADISKEFRGTRITPERYQRNRPLKEYVDRLLGFAKEDPLSIEQEFGNGETITDEIKRLIGGKS